MGRRMRMCGWWCGLAPFGLLLAAALLWAVWGEYTIGSGVYAEYQQQVAFRGQAHFRRVTYYGVAWVRDANDPQPCPLVVHLASGDVTAADLADPDRLPARGWDSITDAAERAAGMPLVLVFREGDYMVSLTYHGDVLVCATVGPASSTAARPDARGIAVSFRDGRLPLPVSEGELLRVVGSPARRTREAGY